MDRSSFFSMMHHPIFLSTIIDFQTSLHYHFIPYYVEMCKFDVLKMTYRSECGPYDLIYITIVI
jgi:hypothetical protein